MKKSDQELGMDRGDHASRLPERGEHRDRGSGGCARGCRGPGAGSLRSSGRFSFHRSFSEPGDVLSTDAHGDAGQPSGLV